MADSGDLIDFNIIESHKENIQSLPGGRSAKALAQLYSPPLLGSSPSPSAASEANAKVRATYERELAAIEEADDPLDIYDRYVKWTLDTYPSAQATPESQLVPLLERATKAFQSSSHYKNDPRYLRMWLHYIHLFSDDPREVFFFLARHNIGAGLALYYEEFAAWLEHAGRWNQAEEIYKMGLEKEARPAERLLRKFSEFEQRKDARPEDPAEPSSPALPVARPALAVKLDPFSSSSPTAAQPQPQGTGLKKPKGSKMQVFQDVEERSSRPGSNGSQGWDNLGTLAERKKENKIEPKPWAGETLKVGKTNGGVPKMMVYRDQSLRHPSIPKHFARRTSRSNHDQQYVLNPKTGRLECVFVNLEAVYPQSGNLSVQYSFEELRAKHRGWLDVDWRSNKQDQGNTRHQITQEKKPLAIVAKGEEKPQKAKAKERAFQIFEDKPGKQSDKPAKVYVETSVKTLALNDENDENRVPSKEEVEMARKARREERANRTRKIKVMDVKHIQNETTKTIQVNMDSPTGPKIKKKKSTGGAEPTMTINTKEAMDEIYGIFSQPLPSQSGQGDGDDEDEDESDSDADDEDDDAYTTGDESTATGKFSAPASEYGDETRNELLAHRDVDDAEKTDATGWSEFTVSKHLPKDTDDGASSVGAEVTMEDTYDQGQEDLVTPVDENPRTEYVAIQPEDYEHPAMHYRGIPNHRLPFMTPIVEQTESSLGIQTQRVEKEHFGTKTPSRKTGVQDSMDDDDQDDEDDVEPGSSPFRDVMSDMEEDKRRVLQPIRTKSTKGNLSLGHGTAKSQLAAKHDGPAGADQDVPTKGPIIKDKQCNPMDPSIRDLILTQTRPSLSSYEGYHDYSDLTFGRTAEIKKYVRNTSKTAKATTSGENKPASNLALPPVIELPGAHGVYTIKRELGAGTFAPVYLAENSTAVSNSATTDSETDDAENSSSQDYAVCKTLGKSAHRKPLEAIKMEEPTSAWEFYMIQQTHRRLGVSRPSQSIVRAHEMHLYADECYLIEEYRSQGTLLDLINLSRHDPTTNTSATAGGTDEVLAMFLTIELLRTVEALHSKYLIHGDLKPDNILVRFDDPGEESDWSPQYFPSGAHGWSSKGVCLIDFGRGIDMRQFVPEIGFLADWKTTDADCAEMRELRPWTYQVDYYGLAGIVHSLLFGRYMETVVEKNAQPPGAGNAPAINGGNLKTYRIRDSLKRYWQTDIWGPLFHLLLNPLAHVANEAAARGAAPRMPLLQGMRGLREQMEAWLEENCERGAGLKALIARLEGGLRERGRRLNK